MIYFLKQKLDEAAAAVGLAKYNKSKFLGTREWVQLGIGQDGRYITGIDENSIEINSIRDLELKEEKKKKVSELRKELENLTGHDLSAKSSFWDEFFFEVSDQLNTANLIDIIKYNILIANNFAALSLQDIDDLNYHNAKFYLANLDAEHEDKVSKKRLKDEATSSLFKLYDNAFKLKLVGKSLLGGIYDDSMTKDNIYNELSDYLDSDKKGENLRKFNDTISKSNEELMVHSLVEDACKDHFGIIRFRNGLYQRGNITYGKTKDEVIKFLANLENANEYVSVKDELDEKKKYGL